MSIGISPKLPLKRSPEDGYWALNKTFLEVYEVMKDNLNILLKMYGKSDKEIKGLLKK